MTTREQAIEMAKKAGFRTWYYDLPDSDFPFIESIGTTCLPEIERLIAIATNAALEHAASECDKPNEHGFHRTCCEVQSAIRALKVS